MDAYEAERGELVEGSRRTCADYAKLGLAGLVICCRDSP
jgi:hypothetical protein